MKEGKAQPKRLPFIFCERHRLQFKSIRGGMLHLAKHPDHRYGCEHTSVNKGCNYDGCTNFRHA